MKKNQLTILALIAGSLFSTQVMANSSFPQKPIKLLVPFAAGGTTDIIARIIADPLGKELGQPVVVDNRGGGGGVIGASETARQEPDGYNLGIATLSSMATNPAINPNAVKYNPLTDFTPIINLAETPNVIAVHPNFPAKDFKAFDALVKKEGNNYSYASSGTGGVQHLLMEYYKSLSGAKITHVPYRGAGPALNDTVAGQVQMNLDNLPSSLPFIQTKKLIPIVVLSKQRIASMPDVPTFAEVGYPDVNRTAFYGIIGPKGMSPELVDKINKATLKVLQNPDVKKRIEATGSFVVGGSPEEFKKQLATELDVYKSVVKKQNLSLDN